MSRVRDGKYDPLLEFKNAVELDNRYAFLLNTSVEIVKMMSLHNDVNSSFIVLSTEYMIEFLSCINVSCVSSLNTQV